MGWKAVAATSGTPFFGSSAATRYVGRAAALCKIEAVGSNSVSGGASSRRMLQVCRVEPPGEFGKG
jgi:hypothetical protein